MATPTVNADDLVTRAAVLENLASGEPSASRAGAEMLVEQARIIGDHEALVVALRALALSHRGLLAHDLAEPLLDEAVRVATRHGLGARLGETLAARGALRHEQGRQRAAHHDLERASVLLTGRGKDEVLLQRAALLQNAGRFTEAATLYSAILRRTGLGADLRTRASNNLGLIQAALGRHRSAAFWLDQAATAAAQVGPAYVAQVTETRAWAEVQAGFLTQGVARFHEAAQLWERADLPLGELYSEYADALITLRLLPEARDQAERAASMLAAQGVPLMAAEAQLRLARLALAMGETKTAEQVAEETARQMRRQRRADWAAHASLIGVRARLESGTSVPADHGVARRAAKVLLSSKTLADAAEAYLAAGQVASAMGRSSLALVDYRKAVELSPRSPVLARLRGHIARALAAEVQGDDAGLTRACRSGLSDLARHRVALPSVELRALASGHGSQLASLGLGALLRNGSASQVLAWMERTRANALSLIDPPPVEGVEEDLAALRAVQADIAGAYREGGGPPHALLARQGEIEARIRRTSWAGGRNGVRSASSLLDFSASALHRALDGRVLVEYDVHEGTVVAVVVGGRTSRIVPLGPLATVEKALNSLRLTLRTLMVGMERMAPALHQVALGAVERLRVQLVAPLDLPGTSGLVVVPVGALQRVPWSALASTAVSVAPSAALWMRTTRRRPTTTSVVLAAGPHLEGAVEEIRALAARYASSLVLVPPESRTETVRRALDGASLAHLACHGHVRADNPTFSSLQLSDGQLAVHDFDRAAAPPHRIVLAACDVGSSVTYPGNEVLGFVGTLLARGTAGLVASTTVVSDAHVGALMVALHDGISAGLPLADALLAARGAVGPADPRTYPAWCTFTAFGAA